MLAQEECDRRKPRRTNALLTSLLIDRVYRRMRREPPPHHFARVAELIQEFRFVAGDATRQNLRFPPNCGNLVTFELADDVERSLDAVQTRSRCDVLPTHQKAHEFG